MDAFLEPFKNSILIKILLALVLFLKSFFFYGQVDKNSDLHKTLKAKDSIIFKSAFNNCNLKDLESIIASDFEFYHDVVGLDTREGFFNSMKNGICKNPGNMKRDLVKNSLEVYSLKKNGKLYGAIQKGKHTFKEKQNGKLTTTGIADFTHLWIFENNNWKLKRVLSYNHKPYTL